MVAKQDYLYRHLVEKGSFLVDFVEFQLHSDHFVHWSQMRRLFRLAIDQDLVAGLVRWLA